MRQTAAGAGKRTGREMDMRRLFGLLAALCAALVALLATFGIPGVGGSSDPAVASAASPAQQIGMKVLLITTANDTASAAGIAYNDWVNTLNREGVPFDSVVTNTASPGSVALPTLSSTAANGTQVADYQGVVVTTSGTAGLSTAQWTALQTFEQHFNVRQVIAYGVPGLANGFGETYLNRTFGATGSGATDTPVPAVTLTSAGAGVFPYLKQVTLDPGTFGYEGTAGAGDSTLLSGPNGSSLLGIYTSSDGRQTLYQTFNENQYMVQSQLLRHGELDWLARNTYFGDQRNYLETDIDDNFLSDDSWSIAGNTTTAAHSTDFNPADALRETPADVQTAAAWSKANNNFRIDMLFNGGGSVAVADGESLVGAGDSGSGGTGSTTGSTSTTCSTTSPCPDPLLAAFTATDSSTSKPYTDDFGWISHTWDHPNIDEGCASQNYIESELNQNTIWGTTAAGGNGNAISNGLGLTSSTDPTTALGNDNPQVIITGEHSGLPNLLPGNPGQVDPPSFDDATASGTGGSLAAGSYLYAISDQFNTADPTQAPVAGAGQSAASIVEVSNVTAGQTVALTWGAVCHAADYIIYRVPYTGTYPTGTMNGSWSVVTVQAANLTTDFKDPTSTSNTSGGGAQPVSYTDTGTSIALPSGISATPPTDGTADESAYEQNPALDAAFPNTLDGGIKYFGSDASKPYPSAADSPFTTGSYTGTEVPSGGTFQDAGGTGIPRYPTNIYYNVSTEAQEIDEYETLYDLPTCKPITGITTCNNPGTTFTMAAIVASVDSGMFSHMMGNDPRPTYFHQTNLMGPSNQAASTTTPPATADTTGDGLFYETMNPLLAEYNAYFASNAPIEQPTMAQIGTLLNEQGVWSTAKGAQVTGSIEGNVVSVTNSSTGTIQVPLTGTTGGTPYAGTQSYWTPVGHGTSTFTALAAWPAAPTVPVKVTVPDGPAPGNGHSGAKPAPVFYYAAQAAPKTVNMKKGAVTVTLACVASRGRTPKGKLCAGTFTLKFSGRTLRHTFRFKSGKTLRVTLKLPKAVQTAFTAMVRHNAVNRRRHKKQQKFSGKLVITTKLSGRQTHAAQGTLTIRS
jgi:hypothetical protein